MKGLFVLLIMLLADAHFACSQDSVYARKMLDTLTSSFFAGRGYTNGGMQKAALFITAQLESFGLLPMKPNGFFQPFSYPANTFPGKMDVVINGKKLLPGMDYIVSPESRGVKGAGVLMKQDSTHYIDPGNRLVVSIENKLTWSVAPKQEDYTAIQVRKNTLDVEPLSVQADIEARLISNFNASNVCAVVKGTRAPDTFIVFTAHYDHLGGMGKSTYFPGANDNASGISLLLSLAKFYSTHPQSYSIAFICFAGEEAGLKGSAYFTEHPLIPLKQIRFLTNVDLVGTGIDGITVVNALEFPKEFAALNTVNDEGKYLVKINPRGRAANSDHYWFTEKGVPAFFIYTLGGIAAYHDVLDKAETLPFNKYNDLFRLIVKFNEKLMR